MKLAVLLGDVDVARLERIGDGRIALEFTGTYRAMRRRPTLGVLYLDRLDAPGAPDFQVPAFFANLLHEGPLRQLVAAAAGVPPDDELRLLAHVGDDLPGAVRLHVLDDAGHPAAPAPDPPAGEPSAGLRFSLAGVQLKFSAVREGRNLVLPASGRGGDWIVKLPDLKYPRVPDNEFATMTWARESGLVVPDFDLVTRADVRGVPDPRFFPDGELAFAVRRFDRAPDGPRIHIEDFAQVNGRRPAHKYDEYRPLPRRLNYDTLANQILTLCGEADLREFVRRLVFVALSGNADAHLKNWSLWYPDGRRPRLSPAYDLVATIAYDDTSDHLALPFAGELAFEAISLAGLRLLGDRLQRDPDELARWGREDTARIMDAYTRARLPYHPDVRYRLTEHHRRMRAAPDSLLGP